MPRRALCLPGARLTVWSARHQWEDGRRRLAAEAAEPARHDQLLDLVDAVADELRRRIGQHFTLEQLAAAHPGAEDWVRELVAERVPPGARAGVRDAALVLDAAFDAYARRALDFGP